MFYEDFSTYQYNIPVELNIVKNIGWLDAENPYNRGAVTTDFMNKLFIIIDKKSLNFYRGKHLCPFCQTSSFPFLEAIYNGKKIPLGSSEMWIPSNNNHHIYASPTLIYHYIEKHGYLPPEDFINSVLAFDINSDWDGEKLRKQLIAEAVK